MFPTRTNCTASALRVRHTRKASPALPTPPRRGRRSPAQQVHYASGTHARAYETALTLLSSPISDMLSPLTYPGRCHTPPRSSASCGKINGTSSVSKYEVRRSTQASMRPRASTASPQCARDPLRSRGRLILTAWVQTDCRCGCTATDRAGASRRFACLLITPPPGHVLCLWLSG